MKFKAVHFNDMCRMLDKARIDAEAVDIKAWELGSKQYPSGNIIDYKGWIVKSGNWFGGFHRLMNPVNYEVRTIPDIFIFEINGRKVYL